MPHAISNAEQGQINDLWTPTPLWATTTLGQTANAKEIQEISQIWLFGASSGPLFGTNTLGVINVQKKFLPILVLEGPG